MKIVILHFLMEIENRRLPVSIWGDHQIQIEMVGGESPYKNGNALSPLITLETARQERSVLLSGDKRLLREG
jgi:hypothetical protein